MPADADYNLLDVARRLEMYGITLYPAKVGNFHVCTYTLLAPVVRKRKDKPLSSAANCFWQDF